jgi:purine-cytosine permease-like protein
MINIAHFFLIRRKYYPNTTENKKYDNKHGGMMKGNIVFLKKAEIVDLRKRKS